MQEGACNPKADAAGGVQRTVRNGDILGFYRRNQKCHRLPSLPEVQTVAVVRLPVPVVPSSAPSCSVVASLRNLSHQETPGRSPLTGEGPPRNGERPSGSP